VEATGNGTQDLPLTIVLSGKGRIEALASERTSLMAKCEMKAAGVWLVAKTDCPVEGGPLFCSFTAGIDAGRADEKAAAFRASRLSE